MQALNLLGNHLDILEPIVDKYVTTLGFPAKSQFNTTCASTATITSDTHRDWLRVLRIYLKHFTAKNTDKSFKVGKVGRVFVFIGDTLTLENSREPLSSCVVQIVHPKASLEASQNAATLVSPCAFWSTHCHLFARPLSPGRCYCFIHAAKALPKTFVR
jgi:hypothetical protein